MKDKFLRVASLWLPVIIWAFLIYRFSSGSIPVASTVFWKDFTVKKTGHVFLFGVLAVLFYRAFVGEGFPRKKAALWAVMFSAFYGATDEYHQMFTQGREGRIRDVFIDTLGASVFIFLVYKLLPNLPKKLKIYFERLGII
ncbi:MAG TPA: VanZ family protein [Patescibacteria group bacterium]|nr:VanZ family protein [Patescibacteria group bacterium]